MSLNTFIAQVKLSWLDKKLFELIYRQITHWGFLFEFNILSIFSLAQLMISKARFFTSSLFSFPTSEP